MCFIVDGVCNQGVCIHEVCVLDRIDLRCQAGNDGADMSLAHVSCLSRLLANSFEWLGEIHLQNGNENLMCVPQAA